MTRREKELDRQALRLIKGAKQQHIAPEVMQVIMDVLRVVALQLEQTRYALLTARNGGWLVTTLSNRNFPELEKQVVYVYPTYEDAMLEAGKLPDMEPICLEMGLLDLLFQLFALQGVDSLIFFDIAGGGRQAKEISRQELQQLCQRQLQLQQSPPYLA